MGHRIREFRRRRGMSAQALADLCADAGMPDLGRQVISNLENGRRDMVTLGEVLMLAYALDVPPVSLFLPMGGESLAITPDIEMDAMRLLLWVSGEQPPSDPRMPTRHPGEKAAVALRPVLEEVSARAQRWAEVAGPLHSYRQLSQEMSQAFMLESLVRRDPAQAERFEEALRNVANVINHMMTSGATPPRVPADWVDRMRLLGLLQYPDAVPVLDEGEDHGEG
ncbi:helix-turn-helix transcriptional regulator [Streptosporangium sp. NPDC006007]|uniref:helix-turn-helix transcriptional regulator n=1 Tax=Streptosporangium sp. NPDC006007 TaxID=3154575 RepID=UPI0033B581D9